MSRIDELIAEHCPDGVPFVPLWQLTTWDKRFNAVDRLKQPKVRKYHYFLASELKQLVVEGGDVKILTTSPTDLWTTEVLSEQYIVEAEVIAIPWGGNPIVQYFDGSFVTSDNRIAVVNDPEALLTKFLYYELLSRLDEISSFYRGSGIKHPSMAQVLDMRVPVPPIEVQREIVRILDTFTQLEAELEAELEARRIQYAHYSETAFQFPDSINREALGAISSMMGGFAFKSSDYAKEGVRVIRISDVQKGTISDKDIKFYPSNKAANFDRYMLRQGDLVVSMSGSVGRVAEVFSEHLPAALNQRVTKIQPHEGVVWPRFLFHFLNRDQFEMDAIGSVTGGTVKNLSSRWLERVMVPVPDLRTQRSIADALDRLGALTNDLSVGLPAELEARRKQYAYYRDKLLTFKELPA